MAVTLVAAAAAQNAGVTTPAATAAITPTVTTTSITNVPKQRCFVFQSHSCETGSAATPANWTASYKDVVVGTGTASAAGGRRFISCYWRDWDGSWTMPSFALASATQNSHAIATLTVMCDPTETFDTPTFSGDGEYFGTAGTAFSAATPSAFNAVSKAFLMAHSVTNDNVTATSGAITGSGFTSGTVTERADGGTATGNDVTIKLHTCSPTTGANVALTHTMTLSAASQGGWAAVQQTATYGGSTPANAFVYDNFRDPDGTVIRTSHTGEVGDTWIRHPGWSGGATEATLAANRAYISGEGAMLTSATPPSADYEVTVTFTIVSYPASGLNFCVIGRGDVNAQYWLNIENDGTLIYINLRRWFFPSFSYVELSPYLNTTRPAVGTTHTATLRMHGNQISCLYDGGTLSGGPYTSNDITVAGKPGFGGVARTATTGYHVESITVTPYPPPPNSGSASGAYTFAGTNAGKRTPKGSATGSYTFAGTAAGKFTAKGSASGAYTFAGSAVGEAPVSAVSEGSASGSYTFAGTASGARTSRGTAAGAYTFAGTAAGKLTAKGSSTGSYTFVGTAAGKLTAKGSASGAYTFAGSAAGTAPAVGAKTGSASGSYTFAGTASGARTSSGSAAGSYTLAGTATGAAPSMGILLGEWGFLGGAYQDTSGNGHHGSLTTGTPTFVNGPTAGTRGIKFGTSNDVITISRTGLEPSADGTTIMGWVRFESTSAATGYLGALSKARAGASTRHRIGMVNTTATREGNAVARWKDDLFLENFGSWSGDGWHHVALVDGNTKWAMYLDGTMYDNGSRAFDNTTSPTWSAHDWIIGRNATIGDVNAHAQMSVSGLRIFQGQLTTAQVVAWKDTPITGALEGTAAGAYTFAGTATGARTSRGSASGSYTFAGTTAGSRTSTGSASGAYTFAGTATGRKTSAGTAAGSYTFAGTAAGKRTPKATASGSYTFVGNTEGESALQGSASGSYTFAGTATGNTPPNSGAATGSYNFTGATTGARTSRGSASGAYTFAGGAVGQAPIVGVESGSALGAYTFSGTTTGARTSRGSAAGSYNFSGTAAGKHTSRGSASGAYTFTGTATGDAPAVGAKTGTASGSYAFTGTTTGARTSRGLAGGGYTWAGSVTGKRTPKATSAGGYTFGGAAVGDTPNEAVRQGSAFGTYNFAGAATGARISLGSAAGNYGWAGSTETTVVPVYHPSQTLTLGQEVRTMSMSIESRTMTMPAETRLITMPSENRTATITGENRSIALPEENRVATLDTETRLISL